MLGLTSHQHCVEVRARRWCSPPIPRGERRRAQGRGKPTLGSYTVSSASSKRRTGAGAGAGNGPDGHLVHKRLMASSKVLPKEFNLPAQALHRCDEIVHLGRGRVLLTYLVDDWCNDEGKEVGGNPAQPTFNGACDC